MMFEYVKSQKNNVDYDYPNVPMTVIYSGVYDMITRFNITNKQQRPLLYHFQKNNHFTYGITEMNRGDSTVGLFG